MPELVVVYDMPIKSDPQGRTWREINRAETHAIPLGTLVELESGVRAFVATHARDCDESPIYSLSHVNPVTDPEDNQLIFCHYLFGPYGAESLTIIRNV